MDIWLPTNQGNAILYQDTPMKFVGTEQKLPTAAMGGSDLANLEDFTWNYDDDDVQAGSNHRTWTAEQVAIASKFINNRSTTATHLPVSSTIRSYMYVPEYAGVLKIWQDVSNPGAAYSVYVNGVLANTPRTCYLKANAITVKINTKDVITVLGSNDVNTKCLFLPYMHPYTYSDIPLRDLRVQLSTLELDGSDIKNDIPNNFANMTPVGGITRVTGRNSKLSLLVNSSNQYIRNQFVPSTGPCKYVARLGDWQKYSMTFSAWVRRQNSASYTGKLFDVRNTGANIFNEIHIDDNRILRARLSYSTSEVGKSTKNAIANYDEWVHVATTYAYPCYTGSTNWNLYVNGQLLGDSDVNHLNTPHQYMSDPIYPPTNHYLQLCGKSGTDAFYGNIQDILMYDRVLSPAEILQIYNAQL